jgi:hypothetical protein
MRKLIVAFHNFATAPKNWWKTIIVTLQQIDYLTFSSYFMYVQSGLTLTNSTFCPHSVFMCFVWIWEQTAIISLYSINWLVFITETECVYCAVRAESLKIQVRLILFLNHRQLEYQNFHFFLLIFCLIHFHFIILSPEGRECAPPPPRSGVTNAFHYTTTHLLFLLDHSLRP